MTSDFFETIFQRIPGPLYVVDLETQKFHLINPAFAELMQGTPSDFENLSVRECVVEEDWDKMLESLKVRTDDSPPMFYRFRAKTFQGNEIALEVSGIRLESPWDSYEVGVVKDLSEELKLEGEVAKERENTLRAFQSTARIWHITDMIRAAFNAMEDLANAKSVDDLLEESIELLTSSKGLDFRSATIYLKEDNRLNVSKSAGDTSARSINLEKNGRLARIYKEIESDEDLKHDDKVIALKGANKTLGLLRVMEHDNLDTELLTESIQRLRDSVLRTFANTLGLMIRNIQLYKKIEEQSIVDALTKVYNRRFFRRKFQEEIERSSRYQHPLGLIMFDIDHFKKVNDVHGHLQGDKILEELGHILLSRVRETDVVCRYGGEEFVVLLPETKLDVVNTVAEEIRDIVENHPFTNTHEGSRESFHITVSAGVSCFCPSESHQMVSQDVLLSDADGALYRAKEEGRNKVVKGHEINQ